MSGRAKSFGWTVAKTRLNIINELHATYGATVARLRAELRAAKGRERELRRRIREARHYINNSAEADLDLADSALDMRRRPLKRQTRRAR